ncbi:MAG: hypothetical protein K2W86_00570 [Sphingomonas sp.]|uniref:hypothetical protein n=1 Tax=Sphingomonas sp. TaxID=28214 RepID=UPI0035A8591B|nr:hypothetical protein [Sphingomonas sp.]
MAKGRKRKTGKRHPSGKLVQPSGAETQREVMATVLDARQRHYGVTARQARDERLGTALGRLAFGEVITAEQHAAGQKYAEIYHRHHAVMGWPMPFPASVTAILASDGILGGVGAPPSRELVEKVRRHYNAVLDVLNRCDRDRLDAPGKAPSVLAYRLVCLDEDAGSWPQADRHNLSFALDALAELFGMARDSHRKVLI